MADDITSFKQKFKVENLKKNSKEENKRQKTLKSKNIK